MRSERLHESGLLDHNAKPRCPKAPCPSPALRAKGGYSSDNETAAPVAGSLALSPRPGAPIVEEAREGAAACKPIQSWVD